MWSMLRTIKEMSKCLPTFAEILNRSDYFLTEKINHDWLLPYLFHAVKKNIQMWSTLRTIKEMSKCLPTFAEIHFLTEKINHGWLLLYLFHAVKKEIQMWSTLRTIKEMSKCLPTFAEILNRTDHFFLVVMLSCWYEFHERAFSDSLISFIVNM
jgi:carbon monoxide dehydrogenase subunit G